jgi:tellurite resistance protein TerA
MIELRKKGQETTIDLTKGGGFPTGPIVANLNWTQKKAQGFWKSLFAKDLDLDLGCFYELTDGTKSVIDALQFSNQGGSRRVVSRQGCFVQKPWIWHTGDDRTGAQSSGEFIEVNPEGLKDIKRIDFYAYIYLERGEVAKWADSDAVITLKIPGHNDIVISMSELSSQKSFAVLCNLEFTSTGIKVTNANTFHDSHSEADLRHGWGMRWRAGSK